MCLKYKSLKFKFLFPMYLIFFFLKHYNKLIVDINYHLRIKISEIKHNKMQCNKLTEAEFQTVSSLIQCLYSEYANFVMAQKCNL